MLIQTRGLPGDLLLHNGHTTNSFFLNDGAPASVLGRMMRSQLLAFEIINIDYVFANHSPALLSSVFAI